MVNMLTTHPKHTKMLQWNSLTQQMEQHQCFTEHGLGTTYVHYNLDNGLNNCAKDENNNGGEHSHSSEQMLAVL